MDQRVILALSVLLDVDILMEAVSKQVHEMHDVTFLTNKAGESSWSYNVQSGVSSSEVEYYEGG